MKQKAIKTLFFSIMLIVVGNAAAKTICFINTWNGQQIEEGKAYYFRTGTDSIRFETIKYYISSIVLYDNDQPTFKEKNSYHLIDFLNPGSTAITLPFSEEIDKIQFNLGIDSITNTSGAMEGDLDPALGMYWTWQSGYINCKIEGTSNLSTAKKQEFQFHLGGYLTLFSSLQTIIIPVTNKADTVFIEFPLEAFFNDMDLSKENAVMIPGMQAKDMAERLARIFRIQAK